MKTYYISLLALFFSTTLSSDIAKMSEQEQKACGIEKLSAEEKQALNTWLAKELSAPKAPVLEKTKIVHGEFLITQNLDLGRFLTLENGITYDIPSRSRKKTMAWKTGDKIRLVEPVRPTNFKLENIEQKVTIGAKISTKKPKTETSKK